MDAQRDARGARGDHEDDEHLRGPSRTVVGFSGSGASRRALRWALLDAAATGALVHVVAVDPPHGPPPVSGPARPPLPSQQLAECLADEREHLPGRAPEVTTAVVTGTAATNLLVAAACADLLVLGCGRRVGPHGPGDGHVLREVLPHAPVPLVLVGPGAVLAPARRLVVVPAADAAGEDVAAGWAARRAVTGGVRSRTVLRGPAREELPAATGVGDLVVCGAGGLAGVPLRTLRAPVVVVPPAARRVVLPDAGAVAGDRRRVPVGRR
ncbi:universal stress protein [Kineococcus sp. SYSU DK004]|uniref:universal stress protein n=1 Tax=Kineococcus sp. SYSU DK004 TaxID=3383125 RepID=UPI003D7DB7CF